MSKTQNSNYTIEYTPHVLPLDLPIVPLFWKTADAPITFLHFHNCIEIGYCYSGEGIIVIEDRTYYFSAGDLSVICPNTMHLSKSHQGTESKWEYLYIDPILLLKDFFPNGFPNADNLMYDSADFVNVLHGDEHPKVKYLVLGLLDELLYKRENYQSSIRGLCLALMIELTRLNPKKFKAQQKQPETRLVISPALEYIDRNYMHKIKIQDLADCCHLSVTHFRRLFSAIIQTGPLEYINHVRVRKSCTLLYNTEESMLNISLQTGFPTVSSFNRHFNEVIGTSPLKWRNSVRSIHSKELKP